MFTYFVRRLAMTIPTLIILSLLVFMSMHFMPIDPAVALMTSYGAGSGADSVPTELITPEMLDQIRKDMGLDRPLYVQFGTWVFDAMRGRFGHSWQTRRPVSRVIASNFRHTVQLATLALAIGTIIAIPLGIMAALKHGGWVDTFVSSAAVIGISMPGFWLGLMLMLYVGMRVSWLPPYGAGTIWHLILPAVALSRGTLALLTRVTRSCMLEVMGNEYITTARSKGLSERVVLGKHALRNALIPVVTLLGLNLGAMLGGTVIMENVFARPGLGRIAVEAVFQKDFPIVQACVLLFAAGFVFANLLVDMTYGFLDPRVRYE